MCARISKERSLELDAPAPALEPSTSKLLCTLIFPLSFAAPYFNSLYTRVHPFYLADIARAFQPHTDLGDHKLIFC